MNRIEQLRKEKGWSQQRLAEIQGVHQTAVSQWEKGRTTPSFETLMSLCSLFDVRPEYLMGTSAERGRFNMSEDELEQLGHDEAETAMLKTLDSDLRRYYAGLNLEGKKKAVEFLAVLAGNVDFRA